VFSAGFAGEVVIVLSGCMVRACNCGKMPTTDTPMDVTAVIKAVITTNLGFCKVLMSLIMFSSVAERNNTEDIPGRTVTSEQIGKLPDLQRRQHEP
jgi:hypothetical protein